MHWLPTNCRSLVNGSSRDLHEGRSHISKLDRSLSKSGLNNNIKISNFEEKYQKIITEQNIIPAVGGDVVTICGALACDDKYLYHSLTDASSTP